MMATVRKRPAENVREHVKKKVSRITDTPYELCTKEPSSRTNDHFFVSVVSSEFGPSMLNLYMYVAEESHFLWTKAKDMFILKSDSEPRKGMLLFHEREMDLKTFCWEQFEFDTLSTSFSNVTWNSSSPSEMVCVFCFSKSFWKNSSKASLKTLKDFVRNVNKSNIFVITDSDEGKHHAVKFCKENQIYTPKHVFQTASDKCRLYETMYEILEKQLASFISDLKARTSTRLVLSFTSELDILLEKLHSRKEKHKIDELLKELILQEKNSVADILNESLGYLRVFKYGAKTGKTAGRIGVVSDFNLFGNDVMTVLPSRSECPTGFFSKKGDSGAILLTRYQRKLHCIGVIYGGGMELPEFNNIREESIAVFLKKA